MNGDQTRYPGGEPRDAQFNPQPPQPQAENRAPEIKIRTMEGDVKPDFNTPGAGAPLSNSSIPEEPVFRPVEPNIAPEPGAPMGGRPPVPPYRPAPKPAGGGINIFTIVVILLIAAGLAAVGYFWIYPFIKTQIAVAPPANEEPPADTNGVPPPEDGGGETPMTYNHTSFFSTPAPRTINVVSPAQLNSLKQAMTSAAAGAEENELNEVVLWRTETGEAALANGQEGTVPILSFDGLLPIILTEFVSDDLKNYFEEDLTAFVYKDGDGVWPGYVGKLKAGANADFAKGVIAEIENSSNLANFFLNETQTSQAFKDGVINKIPARYLPFSANGAALEYGWFGDYLLVTTNYNAAKKAATLLGFSE